MIIFMFIINHTSVFSPFFPANLPTPQPTRKFYITFFFCNFSSGCIKQTKKQTNKCRIWDSCDCCNFLHWSGRGVQYRRVTVVTRAGKSFIFPGDLTQKVDPKYFKDTFKKCTPACYATECRQQVQMLKKNIKNGQIVVFQYDIWNITTRNSFKEVQTYLVLVLLIREIGFEISIKNCPSILFQPYLIHAVAWDGSTITRRKIAICLSSMSTWNGRMRRRSVEEMAVTWLVSSVWRNRLTSMVSKTTRSVEEMGVIWLVSSVWRNRLTSLVSRELLGL